MSISSGTLTRYYTTRATHVFPSLIALQFPSLFISYNEASRARDPKTGHFRIFIASPCEVVLARDPSHTVSSRAFPPGHTSIDYPGPIVPSHLLHPPTPLPPDEQRVSQLCRISARERSFRRESGLHITRCILSSSRRHGFLPDTIASPSPFPHLFEKHKPVLDQRAREMTSVREEKRGFPRRAYNTSDALLTTGRRLYIS